MAGSQTFQHVLPDRLLANAIQELFDDFEVHVGLEERQTHFLQGLSDIFLREHTLPAKFLENPFEFFAQRVKHKSPKKKAIEVRFEPDLRSPRKV